MSGERAGTAREDSVTTREARLQAEGPGAGHGPTWSRKGVAPPDITGGGMPSEHVAFKHPWFSQATDDRHDREVIPHDLVRQLLLDESFQPGERPTSLLNASDASTIEEVSCNFLTRSQRVFKEFSPRPRRKVTVDLWHNAGGTRSRKPLPSADNPCLWRWYGAVEQPIVDGEGTKRITTYNYHSYKLAEHVDRADAGLGPIPVIYHVFTSNALYALEFPDRRRQRRARIRRSNTNSAAESAQSKVPSAVGSPRGPTSCPTSDRSVAQAASSSFGTCPPACAAVVLQTNTVRGRATFLSFTKGAGSDSIGDISLNNAGGIALQSRAGDVAEWHELDEGQTPLLEGDIVAIINGRLSRKGTDSANVLAVVSRKAMVEGSKHDAASTSDAGDTVAYAGRVPVRVRGPVRPGDYIVPSGLEDGTGVRVARRMKASVGCVLSLGPEPLAPGEVWWAEIATLSPGDQVPYLGGWKTGFVLAAAAAVVLGALLVSSWVSSPTPVMPEDIPQMQESEGLILPSACDQAAWNEVLVACKQETNELYTGQHLSWLRRTITAPMSDLNLGRVGNVLIASQVQGLCAAHSRCARALRGYLDYCPLDPVAVSAATSWHNWTREERKTGQSNDCPCEGERPCFQYIDLLFLRQCLASAFPDLLTPSTLTSRDATLASAVRKTTGRAVSIASPSFSGNAGEQEGQENPETDGGKCESATAAVFRECGAVCSTQACDPVFTQGFPADEIGPGSTKLVHPSNCAYLRMDQEKWWNKTMLTAVSGCGCSCYATGTSCEATVANALRVYAQAQAMESPGCFRSSLPASALATMLFSARGLRWIPMQYVIDV